MIDGVSFFSRLSFCCFSWLPSLHLLLALPSWASLASWQWSWSHRDKKEFFFKPKRGPAHFREVERAVLTEYCKLCAMLVFFRSLQVFAIVDFTTASRCSVIVEKLWDYEVLAQLPQELYLGKGMIFMLYLSNIRSNEPCNVQSLADWINIHCSLERVDKWLNEVPPKAEGAKISAADEAGKPRLQMRAKQFCAFLPASPCGSDGSREHPCATVRWAR